MILLWYKHYHLHTGRWKQPGRYIQYLWIQLLKIKNRTKRVGNQSQHTKDRPSCHVREDQLRTNGKIRNPGRRKMWGCIQQMEQEHVIFQCFIGPICKVNKINLPSRIVVCFFWQNDYGMHLMCLIQLSKEIWIQCNSISRRNDSYWTNSSFPIPISCLPRQLFQKVGGRRNRDNREIKCKVYT